MDTRSIPAPAWLTNSKLHVTIKDARTFTGFFYASDQYNNLVLRDVAEGNTQINMVLIPDRYIVEIRTSDQTNWEVEDNDDDDDDDGKEEEGRME